jgi:hypothetical protein
MSDNQKQNQEQKSTDFVTPKISVAWIKANLDKLGELYSNTMSDGNDVGETKQYQAVKDFLQRLLTQTDMTKQPHYQSEDDDDDEEDEEDEEDDEKSS